MGLRGYDCATCSPRSQMARGCRLAGRSFVRFDTVTVDYHKPHRAPLDEILFCPASVPGIFALQQEVLDCLTIKEDGGLRAVYDTSIPKLPHALVSLYYTVEAALGRFLAEVRAVSRHQE